MEFIENEHAKANVRFLCFSKVFHSFCMQNHSFPKVFCTFVYKFLCFAKVFASFRVTFGDSSIFREIRSSEM